MVWASAPRGKKMWYLHRIRAQGSESRLESCGLRKALLTSWSQTFCQLEIGAYPYRDILRSIESLCQGTGAHSIPASDSRPSILTVHLDSIPWQALPLILLGPAHLLDSEATGRIKAGHVGLPLK